MGGGQGQCSGPRRMGEFFRQIKGRLRRTRGCGAELEVFGPTMGVAANRGREIFLYKGQALF